MNRFTYGFGLRIDRAYLLILAFAFLATTISGCVGQGGISIVPLGAKLQNADSAFDEAETMDVARRRPGSNGEESPEKAGALR